MNNEMNSKKENDEKVGMNYHDEVWAATRTASIAALWLIPLFLVLLKEVLEEMIQHVQQRRIRRTTEEQQEQSKHEDRTQQHQNLHHKRPITINSITPTSSSSGAIPNMIIPRIMLPIPGTVGAPFFSGYNVTKFWNH